MAESKKPARAKKPAVKATVKPVKATKRPLLVRILLTPFTYVKESWAELRQVRWPNRRATWSLTGAVLLFTLFWLLVIVGVDIVFQYIFREVLLK